MRMSASRRWRIWETVTQRAETEQVQSRQAGGVVQVARVRLSIEPGPRGSGYRFVNAGAEGQHFARNGR